MVGGHADQSFAAIERLIEGVEGVVSFGICGGLDPALASGTMLLPRAVLDEKKGQRYPVDDTWHAVLAAALRSAHMEIVEDDVLGSGAIIATPAEKALLFKRTMACAVDLESHVVARMAQNARIPFVALRVIADPAWQALPPAALVPLDAEGRPMLPQVLRSIAAQPRQIPDLIRVALETRRALSVLRRGARVLGGAAYKKAE